MFRFSNTTSIFELKKQKDLTFNGQGSIFAPSNSILPLQISQIYLEKREILLKSWGFSNKDDNITTNISFEDAVSNVATFEPCIIPMNGYFLTIDPYCLFMHAKCDNLFYVAGVFCDDSFLVVTTEQINDNFGVLELPLVLNESTEEKWLSKSWSKEVESVKLLQRMVSRLSLSNSLYNGKRCTEEYFNFELQTKTINLAKEAYEKDFPKNINWFDE